MEYQSVDIVTFTFNISSCNIGVFLLIAKTAMVYYIDGTINNGNWIFSDDTTIPASVLVWAPTEPSSDDCLCLFTSEFKHGDTTCSGYVPDFNFGFLCERLI